VDLIMVRKIRDALDEFDVLRRNEADDQKSSASSATTTPARKGGDSVFDFVLVPLAHPRYERMFDLSSKTQPANGTRQLLNLSSRGSGAALGLSRGAPTGSLRSSRASARGGSGSGGSINPRDSLPSSVSGTNNITRQEPFTRPDVDLYTGEWMGAVLGKVSEWIRLDSIHDRVRSNAEEAFFQELAYAAHLSLRAAVVTAPIGGPSGGIANFGSCLNAALLRFPTLQIWLRLPVRVPDSFPSSRVKDGDTWELWNALRCMCDSHPNLGVALEVGALLPTAPGVLERWTAEPLHLMLLSTSAFQMNRHSFPVLSKPHQAFVKAAFRYQPQLAICHRLPPKILETQTVTRGYRLYIDYIAHMFGKQPVPSPQEQFCAKYHDVLIAPPKLLAPQQLRANSHVDAPRLIPALTLAAVEHDTAKYECYTSALHQSFVDRAAAAAGSVKGGLVVLALGGARGGMVNAVIEASKRPGAAALVAIHVVEMNPMAVQTLRSCAANNKEWSCVQVHQGRGFNAERSVGRKQVDVCVTDLLGALGDDELLPEWLETMAAAFKDDVVCIPSKFESFLAPLSSDALHTSLRDASFCARSTSDHPFDSPYIVCINRGSHVAPAQQCFSFSLPASSSSLSSSSSSSSAEKPSYSQQRSLTFNVSESRVLHGFAGYFEAVLYKDLTFSTRPEATQTAGAGGPSQFALYFPLRAPVYLVHDTECTFELWRRSESARVWYEWAVTAPEITALHNVMGHSFSMTTSAFLPHLPQLW